MMRLLRQLLTGCYWLRSQSDVWQMLGVLRRRGAYGAVACDAGSPLCAMQASYTESVRLLCGLPPRKCGWSCHSRWHAVVKMRTSAAVGAATT